MHTKSKISKATLTEVEYLVDAFSQESLVHQLFQLSNTVAINPCDLQDEELQSLVNTLAMLGRFAMTLEKGYYR